MRLFILRLGFLRAVSVVANKGVCHNNETAQWELDCVPKQRLNIDLTGLLGLYYISWVQRVSRTNVIIVVFKLDGCVQVTGCYIISCNHVAWFIFKHDKTKISTLISV